LADVQFLGFSIGGFPTPEVSRTVVPTTLPEVENFGPVLPPDNDEVSRNVVPVNPAEVQNIGVNVNVVSQGQTAGVLDAPGVVIGPVLPSPPLSTSPASGTSQVLSALMRPSSVPTAPIPTTTDIPAVMEASGDPGQGFSGVLLTQFIGQFIRFSSSTRTPALQSLLRKLTIATLNPGGFVFITVDPALPAAPIGIRDIIGATDPVAVPIIDATNTSPIVIKTGAPHGLASGNEVTMSGVGGNTAADGNWVIQVVSPTKFSLFTRAGVASVGNGAYTIGGSYVTPIVITTSTPNGYVTGDSVVVTGVSGNTNANGPWTITVLAPSVFELQTSVSNALYGGAGTVYGPHDTFFLEEDPSTIVSKIFGQGDIVAVEPDAVIKTTIPGKEVILS
jgi:hypothetical protein